jgi:hypothetical protein
MKLIKTTTNAPVDMPRFRPRRSPKRALMVIWMTAITIMLIVVLAIFVHFSLTLMRTVSSLSQ